MGAAAERSRETLEKAAPNKHTGLKSCLKVVQKNSQSPPKVILKLSQNCLKVSKVAHEEGKMNIQALA